MRRALLPLSALRAFEAAARLGSFKAAADELAVTATAVSHQIRSLEATLGTPLFLREVRKVTLTDAGARLFPVARDGFDAFEAALSQVLRTRSRAQVSLSATPAFTAKWLVPRMARFRRRHPAIDLQLHASDTAVDLRSRAVDVAVRYGRGPYPGLRTERLFADRFGPVASPDLGVISPVDLDCVPLIHFTWRRRHPDNPTWPRWFAAADRPWGRAGGELTFSDEGHAIQAAVAGHGIALVSLTLVAGDLAAGRLVQPFGPEIDGHAYHLVQAADRAPRPPVQAVMAWLREEAGASA